MKAQFLIPLPKMLIEDKEELDNKETYYINKEISINWRKMYDFYEKRGNSFLNRMGSYDYLKYKTEISFNFYQNVNEHNVNLLSDREKFREEQKSLIRKIYEIICTLHIKGIEFYYKNYFLKLPWWIFPKFKGYLKLGKTPTRDNKIKKAVLDEISKIYPKIVKTELFSDDRYFILWYHYRELFNSKLIPDIIINAFIILEYLYCRETFGEVTYRLSQNISLFLSKDFDEFENISTFFKKMYRIRSKLVHGGNWQKSLGDFIKDREEFNDTKDVISKLKYYINSSIEKLINLKVLNPNIINELKGDFFLKNSNLTMKGI